MNAEILAPDCSESTVRCHRYVPVAAVQRHLSSSNPSLDERMKLYGALANALVWVTECEIGLADAGPFLDIRPMVTVTGRLLPIFTARDRAPDDGISADPVAFADLVVGLDNDVSLLVDSIDVAVTIPAADVRLLRELLSEDS
ncbi:MAG: hypothetical protein JKY37_27065 [Nannocystaceae bacterium]|nr:hypothetical protein [Nannocystaceae bacterium]